MDKVQFNPATGKVTLNLKPQERDLILETVTILDDEIKKKFQFAVMQKSQLKIILTEEEFDIFEDMLITETRLCKVKKLQDQMFRLISELQFNQDPFEEDLEDDFELDDVINQFTESGLPDELVNLIKNELKINQINNVNDLNRFMEKIDKEYSQTPQQEMGGLTPDQAHKLIYAKWDDPNGCYHYNYNLSDDEINSIKFVKNARLFLQLIHEENGKIKATAKGNLPRVFLNKLFPLFYTEEDIKWLFLNYFKTLTEDRVFDIHIMRIILEDTGLIRKQRNIFNLTKKSQRFLHGNHPQELMQLLFKTFFCKLNLSYLDNNIELESLQDTILYSFYMISQKLDEWQSFETIAEQITLPIIQELAQEGKSFPYLVFHRILNPLVQFGLLEFKEIKIEEKWIRFDYQYRKSPLYDKFFKFTL